MNNTKDHKIISFSCNGGRCRFTIDVDEMIDGGAITAIRKMIGYMQEDPDALETLRGHFQDVYVPLIQENNRKESARYHHMNQATLSKLTRTAELLGIDTGCQNVQTCGRGDFFTSTPDGIKTKTGMLVTCNGLMFGIASEGKRGRKYYRTTELLTGCEIGLSYPTSLTGCFQAIQESAARVAEVLRNNERCRKSMEAVYQAAKENTWTTTKKAREYIINHHEEDNEMKRIEELNARIAELEKELAKKDEIIAELTKKQEPADKIRAAAEPLKALAGITVTIKGEQTVNPVAWIGGDTKKHTEAIKAAGGKWSVKRNAWYIKAA